MLLTMYRSTDAYWGERIEFNGWLGAYPAHWYPQGYRGPGHLHIEFKTDKPLGTSSFSAVIEDFEALGREMVKANPQAAIKAFGAALQEVHAVHPPKPKPVDRPVNATQTDTVTA